ncbi:MAG: sulfatase-like hydrolase/transferase [Anaerolineae bacterium]|nr:sulfatase-like hydrolase/transferase [Anaerolineae bacterium]
MVARPPNIVCIISDDTDFERLGCYGGAAVTPRMDQIAAQGVRFTQAYCTSAACTPSRFSYLTGVYAGRCTDDLFMADNPPDQPYRVTWNTALNESIPSLGHVLRANGYRTGYVGKWHTGHGLDSLGGDVLKPEDDPGDTDADERLRAVQAAAVAAVKRAGGFDFAGAIMWGNPDQFPVRALQYHNLEWMTQQACEFLDSCATDEPFMLYVAATVRHGPSHIDSLEQDVGHTQGGWVESLPRFASTHLPPRATIYERLAMAGVPVNDFNVGLTWLDDQVGAILDKLAVLGVADNTLIIYCTDHNTEPGKATCYDRGIRIPWLMAWPGVIEADTVCEAGVQNIDFVPTVLDACGITPPDTMPLDGTSIFPVLYGGVERIHEDMYFEFGYTRAVRTDRWKYIALRYPADLIAGMQDGSLTEAPNHINQRLQDQASIAAVYYPSYFDPDQLFDLAADPVEQRNLAGDPAYADVLAMMQARLQAYLATFDHPFDLAVPPFMRSPEYRALADATRATGTDHIPWYNPDHIGLTFGVDV